MVGKVKWAEKNGGIEAPRERSKNGQVEKLSKELDGILKRMTDSRTQMSIGKGKPAKTLEQISEEVRNTLKKYGIENNFTDDDVKFMAGLVEGGETRTLEDELWAKFKDGTFYTIDESIPVKKETNGKIAIFLSLSIVTSAILSPNVHCYTYLPGYEFSHSD